MVRSIIALLSICAAFLVGTPAAACGIEGTATRGDGSKVDGTARISTSWNGDKAVPRSGRYSLELGAGACGKTVKVFVDGMTYRDVRVPSSGNARLDIVIR